MGNKGLSFLVLSVVHEYLKSCPICCNETPNLRFRHAFGVYTNTQPCHVYRSSKTSVTLECRTCSIRFMITWRSFTAALKEKLRLEDKPQERKRLTNNIQTLEQFVDTKYSTRKPPVRVNINYGR